MTYKNFCLGSIAFGICIAALTSPASAQFSGLLKKALDAAQNASASAPQSLPASQAPARTLLGEWMNVDASCVAPSSNGEYVEGANLRIEKESIHGFEWGCDLQPAIAEGATSYNGQQVCYGDVGDGTPAPFSLALLPDGTLRMKDGNETQTLRRCD